MQEFLFTIVIIFIIFRLFRGNVFIYKFNANHQRPHEGKQKQEGEITIENSKNKNLNKNKDDGEYVDYEEIK